MPARAQKIFVTGGTGFIGGSLIPRLLAHGHAVTALVRAASAGRLPAGSRPVIGDVLSAESYEAEAHGADCLVHLTGVAHPNPGKAREFIEIDLASARAAIGVAVNAGVKHFVYLSVAQPAPVMGAYVEARRRGEEMVKASGLDATLVRPWYVLGPGRRWPYVLMPAYWLARLLPGMRDFTERLGFVTLEEMTVALLYAVEHPPQGVRVIDVPEIRRLAAAGS
jgi:uncharacterized protein YbjT (DUF2867 family)